MSEPLQDRPSFNDYQGWATSGAIYPGRGSLIGVAYCALKLNGEAGEVAEKIGKAWRDYDGVITPERREAVMLELGDVLWYVANLASELSIPLEQVVAGNMAKIISRRARGKQRGEGDNR